MTKTEVRYTVVQHSAFGYKGDPTFENGLETRRITTKGEAALVARAGGVIFPTYGSAEDYAFDQMYCNVTEGIIPKASGKFSHLKIDDLAIYIPGSVFQVVKDK